MKKNKKIIFGLVAFIILAAIVLAGVSLYKNRNNIRPEMARLKAETFVNNNLMQAGTKATVSEITKAYGLFKVKVDIGSGQKVDSYITLDGKLFFPQGLEMDKADTATSTGSTPSAAQNSPATPTDIPKTDKPTVELFVMSYCPYGTQIEKGILPVVKALGNKINYELKFCDYAMHGEKELRENLTQYCIQKEQNAKFDAYLTCFLKASDSASCLTSAGIDTTKNNACVAKTDSDFKVLANFTSNTDFRGTYPGFNVYKADNAKYSVGGSPTLIINGKEVSSGRDSASLLKTICAAFKTQPKECSTVLSSVAPAAGFGEGAATGAAAAGCAQ